MPGCVPDFSWHTIGGRGNQAFSLVYGLVTVALACGGASAGGLAGSASAAASTVSGGVWRLEQVPGTAKVNVGGLGQMSVVSCTAAVSARWRVLYRWQAHPGVRRRRAQGVRGAAQEASGSAALNVGGTSLPPRSPAHPPGNCAVGGNYTDGRAGLRD
jgi:hypothetical protein